MPHLTQIDQVHLSGSEELEPFKVSYADLSLHQKQLFSSKLEDAAGSNGLAYNEQTLSEEDEHLILGPL